MYGAENQAASEWLGGAACCLWKQALFGHVSFPTASCIDAALPLTLSRLLCSFLLFCTQLPPRQPLFSLDCWSEAAST